MSVRFELMVRLDPRLGRNIHHDDRSRNFAFQPRATVVQTIRHASVIPILDQGQLGSCTGNAAIGALGRFPLYADFHAGFSLDEPEAVRVYSEATALDGYSGTWPPTDTGSDGLSVGKALQRRGVLSSYEHAFGWDAFLAALTRQPVIWGIGWWSNYFYPDGNGVISKLDGDNLEGGHELCVDEIDLDKGLIGGPNSWGSEWGNQGRWYMTFATARAALADDGDATVFTMVPKPEPPVPPSPDVDRYAVADRAFARDLRRNRWLVKHHTGDNAFKARAAQTWLDARGL